MQSGLIARTANKLKRALLMPFQTVYRKVRRILSPESFASQVVRDVRKGIGKKEEIPERSLKDYFSFGQYYVLKKVVYLLLLVCLILPVLYVKLVHPVVVSRFFTKTLVLNSAEMVGYTGKVRLVYEEGGPLLFEGRMDKGRINGKGQLYDYSGVLLYDGNFEMEAYSGEGELYYTDTEKLCYKGGFSLNQYHGQGLLYDVDGNLLYKGEFQK